MTIFERIEGLRASRNISQGKLEKELKFSNGSISKWKNSMPTLDRLQKIADYFGVTIDYLMTGNEDSNNKEIIITSKDERDIAKDLKKMMNDIKNDKNGPFYFDGAPTDEMSREFLANAIESAMRQMKIINKEKYNPHKNKK